jgi:hypothetical protein
MAARRPAETFDKVAETLGREASTQVAQLRSTHDAAGSPFETPQSAPRRLPGLPGVVETDKYQLHIRLHIPLLATPTGRGRSSGARLNRRRRPTSIPAIVPVSAPEGIVRSKDRAQERHHRIVPGNAAAVVVVGSGGRGQGGARQEGGRDCLPQ